MKEPNTQIHKADVLKKIIFQLFVDLQIKCLRFFMYNASFFSWNLGVLSKSETVYHDGLILLFYINNFKYKMHFWIPEL